MIVSLRVDDRLVHGQIITQWVRVLNVNSIVVVNDDVAKDDIQKKIMKMSLAELKSLFCTVEDAKKILNDPRTEKMRILVLAKDLKDALSIVQSVPHIKDINIGNYYRDSVDDNKSKITVTARLTLDYEDQEVVREIIKLSPECYHQSLSTETKKYLKNYV